jgi:hypothetical protein
MKNVLLVSFLFLFLSCKDRGRSAMDEEVIRKSSLADEKIIDADKDKNGCLATAGYVWSKVKKDCIRIYDVAIPLTPIDNMHTEDEMLSVYFIFNEDQSQAEVYLPKNTESVLFTQSNAGSWRYLDWELIAQNAGYVLKDAGVIAFTGDGEIGVKVTGSDKLEED